MAFEWLKVAAQAGKIYSAASKSARVAWSAARPHMPWTARYVSNAVQAVKGLPVATLKHIDHRVAQAGVKREFKGAATGSPKAVAKVNPQAAIKAETQKKVAAAKAKLATRRGKAGTPVAAPTAAPAPRAIKPPPPKQASAGAAKLQPAVRKPGPHAKPEPSPTPNRKGGKTL